MGRAPGEEGTASDERIDYERAGELQGAQAIGGSIWASDLDLTHPLGFGYTRRSLPVWRDHSNFFTLPENAYITVARLTDDPHLSGYVSDENHARLPGSPSVIADQLGRGSVGPAHRQSELPRVLAGHEPPPAQRHLLRRSHSGPVGLRRPRENGLEGRNIAMKWSWKVGHILGIRVQLHMTFLLLLGWVAISFYVERSDLVDALVGVGFILILFGIVVLHELGHALAARRFGIRTRDITLLPIGGVARLERMPDDPREELIVALAGPAVNVVLATLIAGTMLLATGTPIPGEVSFEGGDVLRNLLWVNVVLVLFNMIPAFPMDGGRVLRALLAMRMDYVRATQIAASVGQSLALLFVFAGLFVNPLLVFIGLFVWVGAAGEASMVQMRSSLGGIPVSQAMISDFRAVSPTESLRVVATHIIDGFQQDFPVVEEGRIVGVLTRADLMRAAAEGGLDTLVGAAMRTDFQTAHATEMLEPAFLRLQGCECRSMPVTSRGQLVGVLTMENVGEFLMLQAAAGRAGGA